MAGMELRTLGGYVMNLRVYESIVNGYIMKLKERLKELDPSCRLLEYSIPAMPEKTDESELDMDSEVGLELLSAAVQSNPEIEIYANTVIDLPVADKMDLDF
jgi:hypothetical protein